MMSQELLSALTDEEKRILLELARGAIGQFLADGSMRPLPLAAGSLARPCGAFVTLHRRGKLRGCIGSMAGCGPLVQTVRDMAIAAATEDPRFPRMTEAELDEIEIEISVLSPLERIQDASEIEVGRHGILVRRGWQQGVLLPQVATEWGWGREEFLRHACLKANIPAGAWRDPATIIEIFSAEVFSEGTAGGLGPASRTSRPPPGSRR